MLSENARYENGYAILHTRAYGEKYQMAAIVKVTIKRGNECHMFNLSYKSTGK